MGLGGLVEDVSIAGDGSSLGSCLTFQSFNGVVLVPVTIGPVAGAVDDDDGGGGGCSGAPSADIFSFFSFFSF